jgi:SAM-dependent methyltransferase
VPDKEPWDAIRAFWDGAAATFDDQPEHGLLDPTVRSAWNALLRAHLPDPPADVRDLGCGTGSLTVLLAAGGYRVEAVDLAPAMIAAARDKIASADLLRRSTWGTLPTRAGDPAHTTSSSPVTFSGHCRTPRPPSLGGCGCSAPADGWCSSRDGAGPAAASARRRSAGS